jgi:hypothetical protein
VTGHRALIAAIVLGLILLSATAVFEVVTYTGLEAQQARSDADRSALVTAARGAAVSLKASTQTRVQTVAQRCDLTRLIIVHLLKHASAADTAPFRASQTTCLAQLAAVKAINAATPTPRALRRAILRPPVG